MNRKRLNIAVRGAVTALVVSLSALTASEIATAGPSTQRSEFNPVVVGTPSVTQDQDGRLNVFARGSDNALWYIHQAAPNGGWGGWRNLGGKLTSNPASERNADGRISVFSQGEFGGQAERLITIAQQRPNGDFGDWSSLGGPLKSSPAVGRNLDGRLTVAGIGNAETLWSRTQTSPSSPNYQDWAKIGGTPTPGSRASLAQQADGRIALFYRRKDTNALWQVSQAAPNTNTWGAFSNLGGQLGNSPTAIRDIDGKITVFGHGRNENGLWATTQQSPNSAEFVGFRRLGNGAFAAQQFAVERQGDGRIQVFGRGLDNKVWKTTQQSPASSAYMNQVNLGGAQTADLASGVNHDGTIAVFGRANDSKLWSSTQINTSEAFGTWSIVN